MSEQCCAIGGFTRCLEPTFQGWHLCRRHLEVRPKWSFTIAEEFAEQSPIEQTARTKLANRKTMAAFRKACGDV